MTTRRHRLEGALAAARTALAAARTTEASATAAVALLEGELAELDAIPPRDGVMDLPLPLPEAAARTSTSPCTLRRWIREGRLSATIGARQQYRVKIADVERALESCPAAPPPKRNAPVHDLAEWQDQVDADFMAMARARVR